VSFRVLIARLDLKTPGREVAEEAGENAVVEGSDRARAFVAALGGAANVKSVDACTTRLRLAVVDSGAVDAAALARLGSKGVVRPAPGSVQVVLGPEADQVADAIRAALRSIGQNPEAPAAAPPASPKRPSVDPDDSDPKRPSVDGSAWVDALGGARNIRHAECVATSRVRVEVLDATRVDEDALARLGASGVMRVNNGLVHVLAGKLAAAVARALEPR